MEKFKELMSKCKFSVSILINDHRDFYQTVLEYLEGNNQLTEGNEIDKSVIDKMIETDTIVQIYCYPNTPIGSYNIFHYDVDMAMGLMLEAVNNN